ncbi:ImuA family protein [Novispirillum sp. DQ9]|uniref:ImuA family protein n=1 Tax=Novispirillum sp. DQ9 TaxID=3398612 RepID=UPI003C7D979B
MTAAHTPEALRARIRALEAPAATRAAAIPLGPPEVDGALPWGGLPLGRLHQVTGGEDGFCGPMLGFTAALALRAARQGEVVWIVQAGSGDDVLYGPGLAALGLGPERVLVGRAGEATEVLWTMEEALRCPAVGAVIGQVRAIDLTAGRRLQLAAEQGGGAGFLLPSLHGAGWRAPAPVPLAAATTRWRVEAAPAAPVPWRGLGAARWTVTLERCQGGLPRSWLVERNDATGDFSVVATLPDGPADPGRALGVG